MEVPEKMGGSHTERAHQCCRRRGVFRAGGERAWKGGGRMGEGDMAVVDVGGLKRVDGRRAKQQRCKEMGWSDTERAHQCCRQGKVFRAGRGRAKAVGLGSEAGKGVDGVNDDVEVVEVVGRR
eukprot:scaffold2366_cov159-Amphora_coffeaeformis.AAC.1